MDRAWLDLRLRLADRIAEGLVNGRMEPLDITAATGETLSVSIADDCVVVEAGHEVHSTENVDEAAHEVFQVLHDEWQVVHPVFLDTELVEVPAVKDNDIKVAVPMLDRADSREQLHAWLEAALGEWISGKVKVAPNGSMPWPTRGGNRAVVEVGNPGRIELVSVLARRVSFRKAHEVMDELSRKWLRLKLFLVQDTLMMSQTVIAHPLAADQLTTALGTFMNNRDQLAWVEDKVLSKRARVDRTMIEGLKKGHGQA